MTQGAGERAFAAVQVLAEQSTSVSSVDPRRY
jgi:hypothetical protein